MSHHRLSNLTRAAVFAGLTALTINLGQPADATKVDFSGAYTLTGAKGSLKIDKTSPWTLQVIQDDSEIKIIKTAGAKATTNLFKLDGTEAPYTSSGGVKGTCTARFKGKTLVLDVQVATRPQPNGPTVQMHSREQWTMSTNSKILTIRSEMDFPNSGLGGSQVIEPWSEIYTRN